MRGIFVKGIIPGAQTREAAREHARAAHVGGGRDSPRVGNIVVQADEVNVRVDDVRQIGPAGHEVFLSG